MEQERDRTPEDALVDHLQRVVGALEADDREAAGAVMAEIAFSPAQTERRPSLTPRLQAEVFRRDAFTCRYCGARTVPPPVLRVLSALFPVEFPYHPNWKSDVTHRAHWTIVHQLRPRDRGHLGGRLARAQEPRHGLLDLQPAQGQPLPGAARLEAPPGPRAGLGRPDGRLSEALGAGGPAGPHYHRRWLTAL